MELSKYVAVICEGAAEEAIIDILLDADKLVFNREMLLDENVIRSRSAEAFERRFLRKKYDDKITIFRILDSRNEKFRISRAYQHAVSIVNVVTAPEIEMLVILAEGKYEEYKRSRQKPSIFCKTELHMSAVKSRDFILEYFSDVDKLLFAIKEYRRIAREASNYSNLSDILK